MPWVKIDDSLPDHPKGRHAGTLGLGLFLSGLCYVSRWLTDGFLPAGVVASWIRPHGVAGKKALQRLLHPPLPFVAGLWKEVEGGYLIHDYLEYNPSKEQVLAERKSSKERQNKYREKTGQFGRDERRDIGVSHTVTDTVTNASVTPTPSRPVPSPTRTRTSPPTPSPPDPAFREPREGEENGANEGTEDEFYAAKRGKLGELVQRYGHPLPDQNVAELEAWERDWRAGHGLEPEAEPAKLAG